MGALARPCGSQSRSFDAAASSARLDVAKPRHHMDSPSASFFSHALDETGDVYHRAAHCTVPDLLGAVVGSDAHDIEAPVERFQFRLRVNSHSYPAGRAVFDVDRDPHRDFTLIAIRLQRVEAGRFHQPDHVWSRIHRRQLRVMCGERVFQLDGFRRLAVYADRDGSGYGMCEGALGAAGVAASRISTGTYAAARSILRASTP